MKFLAILQLLPMAEELKTPGIYLLTISNVLLWERLRRLSADFAQLKQFITIKKGQVL